MCFLVVMVFPCLAFLQLSHGSDVVLQWLINLITAGGLIDYIVMCVTYICFYNACKVQGFDRRNFPYYGRFQPYCAYLGLAWMVVVVLCYGYKSLHPWNTQNFFINYTMLIVAPLLFIGWKIFKKTKFIKPKDVDLVWERPTIDAYEETFIDAPVGFWEEMIQVQSHHKP